MVCILCLNETNDGISIYGDSEAAENARLIIVKYFWFRVNLKKIDIFSEILFYLNYLN